MVAALLDAEADAWQGYLGSRTREYGWDPDMSRAGVRTLPGSVPQGHQWELLRFHLNVLCTQQRLVSARRLPLAGQCHLCGGLVDSESHLLECPITRQAEDRLRTAARMPARMASHDEKDDDDDRGEA